MSEFHKTEAKVLYMSITSYIALMPNNGERESLNKRRNSESALDLSIVCNELIELPSTQSNQLKVSRRTAAILWAGNVNENHQE